MLTSLDANEMLTEALHTCCRLDSAVLGGFMLPYWVCHPFTPLEVIVGQAAHTKGLLKLQIQRSLLSKNIY